MSPSRTAHTFPFEILRGAASGRRQAAVVRGDHA